MLEKVLSSSPTPVTTHDLLTSFNFSEPRETLRFVAGYPINESLRFDMNDKSDLSLIWTSKNNSRGAAAQPTEIRLKVPESEINSGTGWDLKAAVLSNFIVTDAASAPEPLASSFLQALLAKGYEIETIKNATLSQAAMNIKLAPSVTIQDTVLGASVSLECEELNLTNVKIFDARIKFQVQRGKWENVSVDGSEVDDAHPYGVASYLDGSLGTTVLDGRCSIGRCRVVADLSNTVLEEDKGGRDLNSRISDQSIWRTNGCPAALRSLLSPTTPEALDKMDKALGAAVFKQVETAEFKTVEDRTTRTKQEVAEFSAIK